MAKRALQYYPRSKSSLGIALSLWTALSLGACTAKPDAEPDAGTPGPGADMAAPGADLAMQTPPDLLPLPPDLSPSYSCRGSDAPGAGFPLAVSQLTLPSSSGGKSFAADLDGDGRPDNQLKSILDTLALGGFELQTSLDQAIADGALVNLIALRTAKTDTSPCVGVLLGQAEPRKTGQPRPKFDGTDMFTLGLKPPALLAGKLAAGMLSTTAPKDQKATEEQVFELRLALSGLDLTLPLRGAHIEGTLEADGVNWRIRNGALHGAISQQDVDGRLLPGIADGLTKLIHSDPFSSTTQTLINLFESKTGTASVTKCMVAASCCRTSPTTCTILPEEVKNSPIGGVLAPDVHVLDDKGKWAPVPRGTPNGLSVGVGFSAISASF